MLQGGPEALSSKFQRSLFFVEYGVSIVSLNLRFYTWFCDQLPLAYYILVGVEVVLSVLSLLVLCAANHNNYEVLEHFWKSEPTPIAWATQFLVSVFRLIPIALVVTFDVVAAAHDASHFPNILVHLFDYAAFLVFWRVAYGRRDFLEPRHLIAFIVLHILFTGSLIGGVSSTFWFCGLSPRQILAYGAETLLLGQIWGEIESCLNRSSV